MRGRIGLLAGSAAVVGLLILSSVGIAMAAEPTPTPGGGPRGPAAGAVDAACRGAGYGFSAVADALQKLAGLKAEEVVAERQAGKSVVQIAREKGVSEDALVKEVLAARKASLDKAVEAGRITQERADFMLKNMAEQVKLGLNRTSVGPGGSGTGPAWAGQGRRGSAQSGRGFGQPGLGTGPGGMNRWAGQGLAR